jgi:hypothetical protein
MFVAQKKGFMMKKYLDIFLFIFLITHTHICCNNLFVQLGQAIGVVEKVAMELIEAFSAKKVVVEKFTLIMIQW